MGWLLPPPPAVQLSELREGVLAKSDVIARPASLCSHLNRRADEQHQQVRDAQVGEEDVCRVAHILRLHNHDGHLQRSLIWDLAILTS